MTKKLFRMLKIMTKDIKEMEFYSDDILERISCEDADIYDIADELAVLETAGSLDEAELDILKSLLVYILMRKSSIEKEDIYALIFGGGRRVLWN
ncbi:MAG: hypothetical protein HZB33_04620 [Nitrospirae bacterium]|nr:hypothetical protein [Nitrospirota bacterium]